MNNATVFSRTWTVSFVPPAARADVEAVLKKIVDTVGGRVAYKGIIPGHIKVLAQFFPGEDFWFLSLTKRGALDEKRPAAGKLPGDPPVASLKLSVAVLVFGHDLQAVEQAVTEALAASELAVQDFAAPAAPAGGDTPPPKGRRFVRYRR